MDLPRSGRQKAPVSGHGEPPQNLQNRERPVPEFAILVGGSVQVDHELVDGESIEPDETRVGEMLVLHTPGHLKRSGLAPSAQ